MREIEGRRFAEAATRLAANDVDHDLLGLLDWRGAARPDNADRLLRFAGRLETLLFGQLPNAPGLFLFGTQSVRPGRSIGASGCGTTPGTAFARCMGELAELTSCRRDMSDRIQKDRRGEPDLSAEELDWCGRMLGLAPDVLTNVDWVEGRRLFGDVEAHVPVDLSVLREKGQNKLGATTNSGVGAGTTAEAAIERGLFELIERDAIAMWWWGGSPARAIAADDGALGDIEEYLVRLRRTGDRRLWLLELTSDIGLPVIAALSSDATGDGVVTGFGADRDKGTAAKAALRELCQMEFAQKISLMKRAYTPSGALSPQDHNWIDKHERLSVGRFPALLPQASPMEVDLPNLRERLTALAVDPVAVDLTDPAVGVQVWRILAPGLQPAKETQITARLERVMARHGRSERNFPDLSPV